MTTLINFIHNFKQDFYPNLNNDTRKQFFFKSLLHMLISLEVTSFTITEDGITLKKLEYLIPSEIGTKKEIISVIKEGLKKNFFIQTKIKKSKYCSLKISKQYSLMITNWYLDKKVKIN